MKIAMFDWKPSVLLFLIQSACICYSKSVKSVISWNRYSFQSFSEIAVLLGGFMRSLNFLGISRRVMTENGARIFQYFTCIEPIILNVSSAAPNLAEQPIDGTQRYTRVEQLRSGHVEWRPTQDR